jgi:hypothetical protein
MTPTHTAPTWSLVTEQPLRLEPVTPDPFIDEPSIDGRARLSSLAHPPSPLRHLSRQSADRRLAARPIAPAHKQ